MRNIYYLSYLYPLFFAKPRTIDSSFEKIYIIYIYFKIFSIESNLYILIVPTVLEFLLRKFDKFM